MGTPHIQHRYRVSSQRLWDNAWFRAAQVVCCVGHRHINIYICVCIRIYLCVSIHLCVCLSSHVQGIYLCVSIHLCVCDCVCVCLSVVTCAGRTHARTVGCCREQHGLARHAWWEELDYSVEFLTKAGLQENVSLIKHKQLHAHVYG